MAKRTRVPRASFAVTLLDDDDYVEMVTTSTGCVALSLYLCLVMCAKVQRNGGVFDCSRALLCRQLKWKSRVFNKAIKYLLESKARWVIENDAGAILIRSFEKWNPGWGGTRDNAGRNSSGNQDDSSANQDAPLENHLDTDSDSDSDSDSYTKTNTPLVDLESRDLKTELPEDSPVTPFERFQQEPAVQTAWRSLPKKARSGYGKFRDEFITTSRREDPEFLTKRLIEYFASPVGKGERWVSAHRFLHDEMYHDDDEAWQQTRESKPETTTAISQSDYMADLDAQVQATRDARLKEREKNEQENREWEARKEREAEA